MFDSYFDYEWISIHAPVQGATFIGLGLDLLLSNFNPRSRVGSDAGKLFNTVARLYFNPRSRVGSDNILVLQLVKLNNFNPRSRVGSDISQLFDFVKSLYFNPRSRVGSDLKSDDGSWYEPEFQSTLPCRERLCGLRQHKGTVKFQSTLPCRERQSQLFQTTLLLMISIHAPVQGATQQGGYIFINSIFQSTLPCRERRYILLFLTYNK